MQFWNETDYAFARTKRVEWSAGGAVRLRDGLRSAYDRRAAVETSVALSPRVSLDASYMFRAVEGNDIRAHNHRLTLGIEYPLLGNGWSLAGKTLYERHFEYSTVPDFNRYRQRFEFEHRQRSWSPWVYQDFTFRDRRGFIRSRSRLGFRWNWTARVSFRLAYQFESLEALGAWRPRHSVYTEVSIDRPFWIVE